MMEGSTSSMAAAIRFSFRCSEFLLELDKFRLLVRLQPQLPVGQKLQVWIKDVLFPFGVVSGFCRITRCPSNQTDVPPGKYDTVYTLISSAGFRRYDYLIV